MGECKACGSCYGVGKCMGRSEPCGDCKGTGAWRGKGRNGFTCLNCERGKACRAKGSSENEPGRL